MDINTRKSNLRSARCVQERQKLLRIAREARKAGYNLTPTFKDGIVWNSNSTEHLLLEFLILTRSLVGSICVQIHQYETPHSRSNFRPCEHIAFHPVTIRACITGEIYQD